MGSVNKTLVFGRNGKGYLQGPTQPFGKARNFHLFKLVEEVMWSRNKVKVVTSIVVRSICGKVEGE